MFGRALREGVSHLPPVEDLREGLYALASNVWEGFKRRCEPSASSRGLKRGFVCPLPPMFGRALREGVSQLPPVEDLREGFVCPCLQRRT
jgi:hypothetical protein